MHGFREKINLDKYLKNFSVIVFGLTLFIAGLTRTIRDLKESRDGTETEQEENEPEQNNYSEPEPNTIKVF